MFRRWIFLRLSQATRISCSQEKKFWAWETRAECSRLTRRQATTTSQWPENSILLLKEREVQKNFWSFCQRRFQPEQMQESSQRKARCGLTRPASLRKEFCALLLKAMREPEWWRQTRLLREQETFPRELPCSRWSSLRRRFQRLILE